MVDALKTTVPPCDCGRFLADGEHHCFIHHICEVTDPDEIVYRVCGECFHVYRTAADLVAAYDREKPEDCPSQRAEDIYFCQECVHDF